MLANLNLNLTRPQLKLLTQTLDHKEDFVVHTSVGVSEYSFTRSTATMFVSSSLLIRTIQFNVPVILVRKTKYKLAFNLLGIS